MRGAEFLDCMEYVDADLVEDVGLDSLDAVDLNVALEETLGFAMTDEELKEIKTVGDIVRYLEAHKEA